MNRIRMHQCDDIKCLAQQKTTFTKEIYQVDATKLCRLIDENEKKTFSQLLCQASNSTHRCSLTMIPDLISIAIHWNSSICTTSHIEDFISIIDPFICLHELFSDVIMIKTLPINQQQRTLIGLVCFYSRTIEVFFSYESRQSQWYFCLDGNLTIMKNWFDVRRKCLEFHLQPYLLIYANANEIFIDRTQLLQRTVVQLKIPSSTNHKSVSMIQQEHDNQTILSKISSFATLNSSMLFLPKTTSTSYINQETVAKVMQQQQQLLLKKEELSTDTSSRIHYRQKSDENLSSENSSISSSSQRDSGFLSNDIHDNQSNETSPRDSLAEIDHLDEQHFDLSLTSIEYYLTQSLKYESASNYTQAIESCQRALTIVEQIYELIHRSNTNLSSYIRTRKNSLLLRMGSLKKRLSQYEQTNEITYEYMIDSLPKKTDNPRTSSILLPTTRLLRPKKNVKFSDNIALIVPTNDDLSEQPAEHLIHSFLRNIQQSSSSSSDSDSDTTSISSNDLPIGLIECSLCHKRFSKVNQIGTYCSNCHFYMQRFQPISP